MRNSTYFCIHTYMSYHWSIGTCPVWILWPYLSRALQSVLLFLSEMDSEECLVGRLWHSLRSGHPPPNPQHTLQRQCPASLHDSSQGKFSPVVAGGFQVCPFQQPPELTTKGCICIHSFTHIVNVLQTPMNAWTYLDIHTCIFRSFDKHSTKYS